MKQYFYIFVIILVFIVITGCEIERDEIKNEINNINSISNLSESEHEDDWINLFMGRWISQTEQDIFLELQDGVEKTGVIEGDLFSSAEFTISDVNKEEQYIIIHGFSVEMPYEEEEPQKEEYTSKLQLLNNGQELLYIYDYLRTKNESKWKR
ncbi:hypothetical protein [Cohnella yongneupensis]|uniref:Uncharacterized protein n=1 Tax=Cohnella yongneupensis TaxID=425006 RepID=A0ABW0QU74_9BACL